ncbi:MAG: hypothetical protein A2636_04240 [Elusimicrobia bacterium RIFCSPHIGHO2_01_FULL_64_10]|nr:MAG: hypothetical protein A2636_04240 [Elusimicrobia bacterium RIFCSPHIGHO2_01_FULL_64_10]
MSGNLTGNPPIVSLDRLTPGDIPSLVEISRESGSARWSQAMFERELDLPFSVCLVARHTSGGQARHGGPAGGGLAGFGGEWCVADAAQVVELAVRPESRGMGVGGELLRGLESAARDRGMRAMELEVREDNFPALRLYRRAGFRTVGRRAGFYSGPAGDAVLMEREICAGPA